MNPVPETKAQTKRRAMDDVRTGPCAATNGGSRATAFGIAQADRLDDGVAAAGGR
jgi:hypothetical protein